MTTLLARAWASAAVFILAGPGALAQVAAEPAVPGAAAEKTWAFDASAYTYFVPDENVFVSPVVKADRGGLHLEARYNYEGFRTGSIWVGYNVSTGEKLVLDFTAMVGAVMGDTAGVAPGYRFTLGYGRVELSSEGEYVFDSRDSSDNFFYNWSELSFAPAEWIRAGVVVQRTRLYGEDRDIQRGVLVGFSYKKAWATAYLFNPDVAKPSFVFALGLGF